MNESSFDTIKSSCTIEAAKEMEELGGKSLVQDRALGSKSNGKQKAAPYLWGAGIPGRETEGQHNCKECGGKRSSEQQCGRKNGENKTTPRPPGVGTAFQVMQPCRWCWNSGTLDSTPGREEIESQA
jgi:hypothetical protein